MANEIIINKFEQRSEFNRSLLSLLDRHMDLDLTHPHAVLLPGGRTPFATYERLAGKPRDIDREFHCILSDERHVPDTSPESNFGRMQPLFAEMGIAQRQFLHPNTALALNECADEYDHALEEFFERGGEITLGILGLGADGHTASLFSPEDLNKHQNPFAIPVQRPEPPNRISVTKYLISKAKRILFICTGTEKEKIVAALEKPDNGLIAARAVEEVDQVELWYSPDRG